VKHVGRFVVFVSAAACAGYTVVYLYRWEWHRAIVAALFLVVAEVAIAAAAILRRLTALDHRLDAMTAAGSPGPAAAPLLEAPVTAPVQALHRLRESAPPPRPVFAWLAPDRTGVFLPILLGAGVLASALAWVVEGLARATARPVLEERLASRLGALALPAGGLLGPAAILAAPPPARRLPMGGRLGLAVLAAVGLGWGIDALADATQTRPAAERAGFRTVVELQLHGEVASAAPERVVTALWHACAGTLNRTMAPPAVTALGGDRFRLEVPADFGEYTARRLHGCLEDAALDRVQAGVISFVAVPHTHGGVSAP
jgi:hypothetical protein